jgi:hypothetical protein
MSRARHVFQSFWQGTSLSPLENVCIESFLAHEHTFVLYAYSDVDNVPDGCVLADAADVLPEESLFFDDDPTGGGSPVGFANHFRYKLLSERGGWWIDADVLCLTREITETPYAFAAQPDDGLYNSAVFKAPSGSALLVHLLERTGELGASFSWGDPGPRLVSELVAALGLEGHAWRAEDVYPLGWREALAVFDPARRTELEERTAGSTFLHLWNHILHLANVLKTVPPPSGSFLDSIYGRYGTSFPTTHRYEWSDLSPQVAFQAEYRKTVDELWQVQNELERLRAFVPPERPWRRWSISGRK